MKKTRLLWKMERASGGPLDSATYVARAKPFGSAVRDLGKLTLLTVRTQVGVDCYVVADAARPDLSAKAASVLANAVGAKASGVDQMPDLSETSVVAQLVARPSLLGSRDTQAGVDPTEVAKTFASTAEPGSWLAITLRKPKRREVDRVRAWNRKRSVSHTHHSLDSEVLIASFYAGAPSAQAATFMLGQVVSALPGMDVDALAQVPSDTTLAAGTGLTGLGVGAGGPWLDSWLTSGPDGVPTSIIDVAAAAPVSLTMAGLGVGIPLLATAGAAIAGRLPTRRQALRSSADSLSWPTPAVGGSAIPAPKKTEDGTLVESTKLPYPLASTSFLVGPSVIAGIAAPHGGSSSGAAQTGMRAAPPALRADVGPYIGTDGDGNKVHISAADSTASIAVLGIPDAGKLLSLDSRIPVPVCDRFPQGWATVGELAVGDQVYTQDGTITDVVRLSPVEETPILFDVELIDGRKVTADANHVWKVSTSISRVAHRPLALARRTETITANEASALKCQLMAGRTQADLGATVSELARMVGSTYGPVSTCIEAYGLAGQTAYLQASPTWAAAFDANELADALVASRGQRFPHTPEQIQRLRDAGGRLTGTQAATLMVDEDVALTKKRGRRIQGIAAGAGLSSRRVLLAASDRPGTGTKTTLYPVAEFLLAWAQSFLYRGDQSRPGMRAVQPLEHLMTTAEMAERLLTSDGKNNLSIRAHGPITGEFIEAPVDPYTLGAWLGDGTSGSGSFTQADQSPTPLEEQTQLSDRAHLIEQLGQYDPRPIGGLGIGTRGLCTALNSIGVRGNKHIPAIYQRAHIEQRLALLQGLMDTDGSITKDGHCELTLSDERLATDALELIRGLGIKAGRTITAAGYRNADGEYVPCKNRHRIHFSPRIQVFRLPRKARHVKLEVDGDQSGWTPIVSITPVQSRPGRCITVSDPSGMFLAEDFVPTHNSVAIRALYGWAVLERVTPSGKPGRPGRTNTLIAFENKGEGAAEYVKWGTELGDHPLLIELADPATPAIDVFAGPTDRRAKAKQVAEAMQYAFPAGSIQRQSLSTLTLTLFAAQLIDDEIAGWAEVPAGLSVVEYAAILLGAGQDADGVRLATAIARAAMERDHPDYADSLTALGPMYGEKTTPTQRRQLQDAPRTKIETLVEARDWFAPNRPRLSWSQILTEHDNVVINAGVSASGAMVSAEVTSVMSSMMLYTLRDAIMRTCSGWKDLGRYTSIFVDELSLLAKDTPEVITWLRNQGRSYGINQYLATQYPDQLHDEVRKAMLSFGTAYWFRQTNAAIAAMAAESLSVDGSNWTGADIYSLPAHTAVVAAQVGKAPQPATTVKIGYWEPDRLSFAPAQGYELTALPAPVRHFENTPPPEKQDSTVGIQPDDEHQASGAESGSATQAQEPESPVAVPAPEYEFGEDDPFDPDRF